MVIFQVRCVRYGLPHFQVRLPGNITVFCLSSTSNPELFLLKLRVPQSSTIQQNDLNDLLELFYRSYITGHCIFLLCREYTIHCILVCNVTLFLHIIWHFDLFDLFQYKSRRDLPVQLCCFYVAQTVGFTGGQQEQIRLAHRNNKCHT